MVLQAACLVPQNHMTKMEQKHKLYFILISTVRIVSGPCVSVRMQVCVCRLYFYATK